MAHNHKKDKGFADAEDDMQKDIPGEGDKASHEKDMEGDLERGGDMDADRKGEDKRGMDTGKDEGQ